MSGDGLKVSGEGKFHQVSSGPEQDTGAFGSSGHGEDGRKPPDDFVYVVDESKKKAAPGLLDRSALASEGAHAAEAETEETGTKEKLMVAATLAFVAILVAVGAVAMVYGTSADLERIEAAVNAEAVAIQPPPDDVQGVKVRKGIKHQPTQPAKRSGVQPVEVVDDRPDIPVNTVPDGAPPPEPKAPPVPETEATAIPSGDAPP